MTGDSLPKFRKPPVIEAYCAVYFRDLMDLNAPHLGAFWEPIRGEFPFTETQPALPPLFMSNPVGTGVLFQSPSMDFPRSWFLSKDKTILIQIQRDRLIVNWRKTDEDSAYPSFDTVKQKFDTVFGLFKSVINTQLAGEIHITGIETGYVNNIVTDKCRINQIIPALNPQLLINDADCDSSSVNFWSSFEFPKNKGGITIHINTLGANVIRVNIISRWIAEISEVAAQEWLNYAHMRNVTAFAACTSDKMHNVWERIK